MRAAVRKPAPAHAGDSRSAELVESSGGGRVPVGGRQEAWEARWAVCCKGGAPCEAQLVEDAHLVMWRPRGELSAGDRSLNGETGEEQVEAERMGPAQQRHWERGADTGASCALGAGNVHLWQMCGQMQLREHAEAVSRASALRWRQFLRWIRWEPSEVSLAWEGRAPEASFQDVAAAVLKAPARCCLQGQCQWAHPRRGWLPEQGEQEPGKRAGQAQFLVGTLSFQPWLEPRFQPGVSLPESPGPVTLGSADIGGLLLHTCCLPGCERVCSCGQEQGLLHLQIPGSNPVALSTGPGWGKLLAPGS